MKYFTLPGYGGSGAEHWQSYFEKDLPNCERVEQADWDNPDCTEWVNTLEQKIADCADEEIILLAHSLGCITLAHWVARFQQKVKAALLVAPPDLENQKHSFQSFTPTPLKTLPFKTILVSSDNDPWIKKERAEFLAKQWGSDFVLLQNAGHINADAGYGKWEDGLKLVQKLTAD